MVLISIERDGRFIVPEGQTRFAAKDRIRALARPSYAGIAVVGGKNASLVFVSCRL